MLLVLAVSPEKGIMIFAFAFSSGSQIRDEIWVSGGELLLLHTSFLDIYELGISQDIPVLAHSFIFGIRVGNLHFGCHTFLPLDTWVLPLRIGRNARLFHATAMALSHLEYFTSGAYHLRHSRRR